MLREDIDLQHAQIQQLENRNQVAAFFGRLGYTIEARLTQTAGALGITSADLQRQITHIEQIASQDDELYVYLFEVKSMRVADRLALARNFRNASGEFLLVITDDYTKLDFVLLERKRPEDGKAGLGRKQVTVLPHVLTVNRKDPGNVALRALRRFTYTEPDPLYQYEKLLSAYVVAEWSEPLFNNRALFSDYYLNIRLRDLPVWREDPLPAYNALRRPLVTARQDLAQGDEAATRRMLLEPVFEALGFRWEAFPSGDAQPDYRLYDSAAEAGSAPLARCLAYKWDRYLDGPDDTRDPDTPDENPGARVITLLEDGETPYVIVTNGKLWRLYAARAHSRATNYYEIDLAEAIAPADPIDRAEALRYFWLFFRREAFVSQDVIRDGETRQLCFLDHLLEESAAYAKELEDRLKDRIFDQIFPHFAEGFIEDIRRREGKAADLSQERLDAVYRGTLTFLYRLMFLLYAEARDLLPVRDEHGYHAASLTRLKAEVAKAAGDIEDAAPGKLRKAYETTSTTLYDRLARLFAVIDQGDPSLNVPRYNGGLFITQPRPDGDSPEDIDARFLRDTKVPDRYLALGLDRLARDVDTKRHDLVMIDYKSLGVRQLGSIYEGLLEFKLRVAPQKMALVKGKRTEEVVPYAEAVKKKLPILTTGRGQGKQERTLAKGDVYLENTRQERKATGSYYTPDYIVKYIVAHTVGPVLAEKFAALTPRLRQAERDYHDRRKTALQKGEEPEKFWNNDTMLRLAYDALDLKVLDPAMGSGHFLVEAVDFVTDRLIKFLYGFRHNPVRASLRDIRKNILDAMEDQGVSIDPRHLDEIPLLKRQVLKRCVYGVDLNPMAVELAKVSLWLDAFTLGAPLSFLDHHLRCGNSLIGTMARDAEVELQRESTGQMTLFKGPFVGLLRQAELMRGIGTLADATIEQAHQSADLFRKFEEAARPYKQLLDVFVIRHFGVKRADEFLRLFGADVMQTDAATLQGPYQEVLAERERLYRQYRFFHWDLEFPEVFIDLEHARWKENAGFDAVVGNPPYQVMENMEALQRTYFYEATLSGRRVYEVAESKANIYSIFWEASLHLLSPRALFGMITPYSWISNSSFRKLRKYLLENSSPKFISAFPVGVFEGVGIATGIFIIQNRRPSANDSTRVLDAREIPLLLLKDVLSSDDEPIVSVEFAKIVDGDIINVASVTGTQAVLKRLGKNSALLETLCDIQYGCKTADTNQFVGSEYLPSRNSRRLLAGEDITRHEYEWGGKYLYYEPGEMLRLHETARPGEPERFEVDEKIIVYRFFDEKGRFESIWDTEQFYCLDSCYVLLSKPNSREKLGFVQAVLASGLIAFHNRAFAGVKVTQTEMKRVPVPLISFTTHTDRRSEFAEKGRELYQRCVSEGQACVLEFVEHHLGLGETDVIHDLLAYLAETMIDLNKHKQAEVKRFLGWLEGQIGARVDDLTGKTTIQGYLGDYQKGEPEKLFDALWDVLHKNRGKLSVNLSDRTLELRLGEAHAASLSVLLPIKGQLATTDALIDQVVYRLYGLTEEEIAIVEGRA